jgi:hypothetical protein
MHPSSIIVSSGMEHMPVLGRQLRFLSNTLSEEKQNKTQDNVLKQK